MIYRKRVTQTAIVSICGSVGLFFLSRRLRSQGWGKVAAQADLSEGGSRFPKSYPNDPDTVSVSKAMSLKAVQVFFRHGARTPLKHIPGLQEVVYDSKFLVASVPYTEIPLNVQHIDGGPRPASRLQNHYSSIKFKGGVAAGVLTTTGKDQMYLFGKQLAAKYGHFIGKEFNADQVLVRSTNIDRCIGSVQCVLAGMFGHLSFSDKDPVVVYVDNLSSEILIPSTYQCPTFCKLSDSSKIALERNPDYINLINIIQSHTGVFCDISEVDMMQMRDHIVARKVHGLPVPDFLEKLQEDIEKAAVTVLSTIICGNVQENPTLGLSFSIGRSLNMIKHNLLSSKSSDQQEPNRRKLFLYACHDSSLAALLLAFGCFDNQWPPYAADVAVELYEDKFGQHWIQTVYCGKAMLLRGCSSTLITLDQFLQIIEPYILTSEQYSVYCSDFSKAVNRIKIFAKPHKCADAEYKAPSNI